MHHQLRRHLALHGRRTGRPVTVRDHRDAHLADKLGQFHRHLRLAVRHRDLVRPERQRLEAPRRRGTDAAEHLRPEATARLDAAHLQRVLADHRQDAVVEVKERMLRLTWFGEISDRIRRRLARQQVDRLVDNRHPRKSRAGRIHRHVHRPQVNHPRINRDRHLVRQRTDTDRGLSASTHRQVPGVRPHPLHDRDVHVEVRRVLGRHRTQHDLARRIGERLHLGVDLLLAQHRDERMPGERRLHRQPRRFADTIERLVRNQRDGRRILQRCADDIVAPAAQVEGTSERHARFRIRHRKRIVSVRRNRQLHARRSARRRLDGDAVRNRHAQTFARPGAPSVFGLLVAVDRVDALELQRQLLRRGQGLAGPIDADESDARLQARLQLHPFGQVRADVKGIVVQNLAPAHGRGTSPVLEHHALSGHADRRLRTSGVRPERRLEAALARAIQLAVADFAVGRTKPEVVVAEMPAFPRGGCERHVLEDNRTLALETVRGAAEEVFGFDREGEVRGMRGRFGLDLHADLRRGELLDLDFTPPVHPSRTARQECPDAARLVGGDGKLVPRDRALGVGQDRLVRHIVALRIAQHKLDGHRLRSPTVLVAQNRLQENVLVMTVNAAVRPEEGLILASLEVIRTVAVGIRLIDLHRLAQRHERHVVSVRRDDHDRKRLALLNALGNAPTLRVAAALHHLDVGRRININPCARDGLPRRQGRDPHAQTIGAALANAQSKVRKTDDTVTNWIQNLASPGPIAFRQVRIENRNEVDAIRWLAVLHIDRQPRQLLDIRTVRAAKHIRHLFAGEFFRLLVIRTGAVLIAPIHPFFPREHLHDVPWLDAADGRQDIGHVHGLDLNRPLAAGR